LFHTAPGEMSGSISMILASRVAGSDMMLVTGACASLCTSVVRAVLVIVVVVLVLVPAPARVPTRAPLLELCASMDIVC
jgi:hypothetical protein